MGGAAVSACWEHPNPFLEIRNITFLPIRKMPVSIVVEMELAKKFCEFSRECCQKRVL
jgi:hypothetical protein